MADKQPSAIYEYDEFDNINTANLSPPKEKVPIKDF